MRNTIARGLNEVVKDEMVVRDQIAAFVADGPKTIPAIAEYLGHPPHEVVIWVMALWKYGTLRATGEPDSDGYYAYDLNE